jgi:ankyrin repeat protein
MKPKNRIVAIGCIIGAVCVAVFATEIDECNPAELITSAMHRADTQEIQTIAERFPQVIQQTNKFGHLPLHEAAGFHNLEVTRLLLKKGAKPDVRDSRNEETALMTAVLSRVMDKPNSPLHKADNLMGTIKELLAAGADPTLSVSNGMTVLHMACISMRQEVVELLLAAKVPVNVKDKRGMTPLDVAISYKQLGIAEKLAAAGAELNIRSAAALGKEAEVKAFLSKNKNSIRDCDIQGNTPLHFAAIFGRTTIIALLLDNGAAPNARAEGGITPVIEAACKQEQPQVLDEFRKHGINVDRILSEWRPAPAVGGVRPSQSTE